MKRVGGRVTVGIGGAACPGKAYPGRGLAKTVLMAALLTTTCLSIMHPALARTADQPSEQLAQALAPRAFDIPAQPLGSALTAFGQQSGMQVSVDAVLVRDIRAPAVTGTMTPDAALARLIAGTGLNYRIVDSNTVTLQRAADGSDDTTLVLSTLVVEGDAAAESPYGPGDGFVAHRTMSGTKTNTPLVKTPQSISVVTREEMDAHAVQNVDQALRYTAGIVTESTGVDNRFDQIGGRGFTLDEYLDGTKLLFSSAGFAVPQVDPYLLERAEVVRGPSSVLYGQASPGGVLNLVSKRPTADQVNEVQIQGGNYAEKQAAFDIGGAVNEDETVLYRLTGLARNAETEVDHTEYERYLIAPAFTWRPSEDTDLTVLLSYQADPKAGFFNKLPAQGTALPNTAGEISTDFYAGEPDFDELDRKTASAGYAFEHRFSDLWTVRQNFRYLHMDSDFAAVFAGAALQPDGRTLPRQLYMSNEGLDNVTVDNQAQATFATGALGHTVLLGADYQWRRWDQVARFGLAPSIDVFDPVYGQALTIPGVFANQVQNQEQVGLYAQDQLDYGNWSLLLGGRWDYAESSIDNTLTDSETSTVDHAFTGRVGMSYQFDNGIAPYASYGESFQPTTGTDFSGDPFAPTTGNQYEIGVKYQPPGTNSLISAAVYQLTQQNVLTSDPAHTQFSVQTGEVRSRGIEIEGKASLTNNLSLTASYAYVDPEVTKANDGTEGNSPVAVPNHLASTWADYTVTDGSFSGLGFGVGVRYRGASYGDSANTFKIDSATLFDAAIRYDLGALNDDLEGLQFSINGTNLFDKEYVARCQDNGCYYGLRRTVLATLKYRW